MAQAKRKAIDRGKRDRLSSNLDVVLTGKLLAELLSKYCPTLNVPGPQQLREFVNTLQELRGRAALHRELFREAHLRLQRTQEAIACLQETLPIISAPFERAVVDLTESRVLLEDCLGCTPEVIAGHEAMLTEHAKRVALLQLALESVSAVLTSPVLPFPVAAHSKTKFEDKWDSFVRDVYLAYERALRPNNPNAPLKAHQQGPGAPLIAVLMSYVTGEEWLKSSTVQDKVREKLAQRNAAP